MLLKFISRITFLHSLASIIVNLVPFFILHNFSKYYALRKSLQIIKMDKIKGDYCEFGCFTGASLNHVLRVTSKDAFLKEKKIYGFDSFSGFPKEVHSEFKSEIFTADYDKVKKLEVKSKGRCIIKKGFFNDVLNNEDLKNEIQKISLAFIDCDLAISSQPVFEFIKNRMVNGSFIVIDDYFNIDQERNSIREEFKKHFDINKNVFKFSSYGLGGVVYQYIEN